ncbi:MAG: DUF4838 domain-containing protein [Ruminococcaceae bacterium]|nr:DUF4838 domain-containing protein [Oscillospiraceae bacterium]
MKRLLSVLICLLMTLSCLSVTVLGWEREIIYDDTFTVGDADGSGEVNAVDSYMIKASLAGVEGASYDPSAADLDADGKLSAVDSYYMKAYLAGAVAIEELDSEKSLYRLTVGGYDISEFCIVIPAGSTSEDNVDYASKEFRKYIEYACGIKLDICYSDEERSAPHAVVFNAVDELSDLGKELGIEGYRYDVTDGDVNVYGTRRGNMYWVYDFLERIGFEFFSDRETFVWKVRSVHVPEGESGEVHPRLSYRFAGQTFSKEGSVYHFFPNKLNGSQLYAHDGTKYGTLTGPHFINAHSMGYYWRMATGNYTDDDHLKECYQSGYQQQETDYAAIPPWQPCADPKSGDYDVLYLGMKRTMTMIQQWGHVFRRETSSMSFSICDNTAGYCSCRFCFRKSRTEGYSGVYIDLTNRAARDIVEIYPGMKVMSIIYDHTIPETVRPEKNVVIFFCGQGCNNHYLGHPEDCGDNGPVLAKLTNAYTEEALKAWTEMCHSVGAEIWFWYYPVTYRNIIAPCPNVLNVYYDTTFVINECGVDGFYYEGGGEEYAFEPLKAYLAVRVMNNPAMTYDEFVAEAKDYLYMYYGDGYELVWQYVLMQTEAGNTDNCYLNNFSLCDDMYDFEYLTENYRRMREILLEAMTMTDDADHIYRLNTLLCTCDFVGLSAVYDSWYANGTEETRAEYRENMEWMIGFVKENGMHFGAPSFIVPETVDYSCSLLDQI